MHLRTVIAGSGKIKRRYAQLVQSYRRDDGVPAQRVVASLGALGDQEIHNLKLALEASRLGKALVLPTTSTWRPRVVANLAYLDVAVALSLWREWELSDLLMSLVPDRGAEVSCCDVVAALTVQRCVSPGSKLAFQRWLPRSALPELLGLEPGQVNNSRVHRVLAELDKVEEKLQEGLARRYVQRDGAFATLFTDVSDAWFEGRGPDLAARSRTKEGLPNRYKVGILLLCTERGYPLRWKALEGKARDTEALCDLVGEVEHLSWARGVPIVFDRAMGNATSVSRLLKSGLHFLTAVRRPEFGTYADEEALPAAALEELGGSEDADEQRKVMVEAAKRVTSAGMQKVDELLYVLDLGVVERAVRDEPDAIEVEVAPESLSAGAAWLYKARQFRRQLRDKTFATQSQIAASLGLTRSRLTQIMTMVRLDEELQVEVLKGTFGEIPERTLRAIAALPGKERQRRALEDLSGTKQIKVSDSRREQTRQALARYTARLRVVAYFNPRMFVDQRTLGEKHRRLVEDLVVDLNRRLRRAPMRRSALSVQLELREELARWSMLSVYDFEVALVKNDEPAHLEVRLSFDEKTWARRKRQDGFVLLVAHPEIIRGAAELVQLYRDKDAIEKDFQTIKTELRLRPVFHHTDPKVRAHISLCMLALLLERSLEQRLRHAGSPMTAPACLEELSTCYLNVLEASPSTEPAYTLTKPTAEQRALLERLGLQGLLDEDDLVERIRPRSSK